MLISLFPGSVSCGTLQYRCDSGQCVSEALRCDGYADCGDGTDEMHCSKPPRCLTQLRCPNSHKCLQKEWLCDGEDDCQDGSDEKVGSERDETSRCAENKGNALEKQRRKCFNLCPELQYWSGEVLEVPVAVWRQQSVPSSVLEV